MSWVERSTGISPTITNSLFAHVFGRIDSIDAEYRPTSASQSARPPLWHRLGPFHMPLLAERCRQRTVAIPIVAVGDVISAGVGEQRAQP
jgi:hypothetical protein